MKLFSRGRHRDGIALTDIKSRLLAERTTYRFDVVPFDQIMARLKQGGAK